MGNKILSWLVATIMITTFVPMVSFGAEADAENVEKQVVAESQATPEQETSTDEAITDAIDSEKERADDISNLKAGEDEEATTSGTCGENLTWILDENGTLTIRGTGAMKDYYTGSVSSGTTYLETPWEENQSKIKQIIIEEGVTHIGGVAFTCLENLTNIQMPDSLKSIGIDAFGSCERLESIVLPDNVESIGSGAFNGCYGLESIVLPTSMTVIETQLLGHCSSLKSIVIPDGVTDIGDSAFAGCSSLGTIEIPDSVTTIGAGAFSGCSSLKSIELPEEVTDIGGSAFEGCSSLEVISIPQGIKTIMYQTFKGCSNLKNIELPEGVMSIENAAFNGCSSLESIDIPEKVSKIGDEAFVDCIKLKKILIPRDADKYILFGNYIFCTQTSTPLKDIEIVINCDIAGTSGHYCFYGLDKTSTISHPCTNNWAAKERNTSNVGWNAKHVLPETYTIYRRASFNNDGYMYKQCANYYYCFYKDGVTIPTLEKKIYLSNDECTYDEGEHKPEVTVKDVEGNIINSDCYSVSYGNNVNAGTASVQVVLDSDEYEGSFSGHFIINKADQTINLKTKEIKVQKKKSKQIELAENIAGAITYSVENKKIATVSSTGVVKGIKIGSTKITVTAAGDENHNPATASVDVIVPTVISSATLTKTGFTYNGEEQIPAIKKINKKTLIEGTDYEVTWPEEPVSAGTYKVTVTGIGQYDGSKTVSYKINKAKQTITVDTPSMIIDEAYKLEPSANETDVFTYKSSSTKTATVDVDGVITAKKAGTVKITITAPACDNYNKATKTIKVKIAKKPQTIYVTPESAELIAKDSEKGSVQLAVAEGYVGKITYSSTNSKIASVSKSGLVKGLKAGTVKIKVKAAGNATVAPVTFEVPITVKTAE